MMVMSTSGICYLTLFMLHVCFCSMTQLLPR